MNFRSKKWTVPLLVLLILISIGILIQFSLGFGMFLNSFQKNPFKQQSSINVSVSGDKLNLKFNLIPEDRPVFNQFIKNWFGKERQINTLDLEIDGSTAKFLEPITPADLELFVTEKTLEFKNQSVPLLQNARTFSDYEFASGSGKVKINYTDNSKYQFSAQNPYDLVDYATSSGTLTVSDKLEGLFKSLPQVATIELNVNGKNIAGKIVLK